MPDNPSLNLIQLATAHQTDLKPHRDRRDRIRAYRSPRAQFNRWRNSETGQTWKKEQLRAINLTCPACDRRKYPEDFVIDHKIPISKGGHPTHSSNLQLLCYPCNLSKGKTLHEAP